MKHITSAGATALVVMSLLATAAEAKDNTRHTVQQITAYCNTAKYNECHAAAANNYLACAENDVDCRCAQLQVLADQCAPLCPTTEVSNAELIRSYCAQSTMQSFATASADVHSNSLMELKKKLKEKLFGKFKGEDPDCPDDKHEDHGDDCPEDKHNTGHDDTSGDDHCDDKCDGDDHHDDCDNKYDDDDDDCPDDKYDGEDDDDCDDKYDGEDDCDEECDEYDDHHDDCAQYYSYANESDTPSPKADAQLSAPVAQVKASNLRAMKSSYEKEAAIPGRFQRRSSIDKLRAAADAKQLHIVPRNVADFLDDEPNARLFRDFLPSAMDDDGCDDDDEDCMLDGLSPSFYADEMNALHEERASANIIGWPSIPWPWKDEDQNDDDCEDDKTPEPAPVEDDCGDEDKDQWTAPVEDDCGDEDKDQWTAPVEDDCGDEDKDQWTAPVEDDCGDEDKSSWDDHSGGDDDDCGDEDKSSWDDHSGNDDDDCGEDSDKSGNEPSYDKKKSKHGVVAAPDTDESNDEDGDDDEESHDDDGDDSNGDDSDDSDDSNGDGDADSDDSESDSNDSDSDDSEVKVDGDEPKNGTRQGLRNAIKNVGANIKNATGSGVESSASSVVRQGVAEVVFGIVAAAGVGMALL